MARPLALALLLLALTACEPKRPCKQVECHYVGFYIAATGPCGSWFWEPKQCECIRY